MVDTSVLRTDTKRALIRWTRLQPSVAKKICVCGPRVKGSVSSASRILKKYNCRARQRLVTE